MSEFDRPSAGQTRESFRNRRIVEREVANEDRFEEAMEAGRLGGPDAEAAVLARHEQEKAAERAEDIRVEQAAHEAFGRAAQEAFDGTRLLGSEQDFMPPERMDVMFGYIEAEQQRFWERQQQERDPDEDRDDEERER